MYTYVYACNSNYLINAVAAMQNRCIEWGDLINALIKYFIVFSEP